MERFLAQRHFPDIADGRNQPAFRQRLFVVIRWINVVAARQQQAASSNDALCAAYHTVSQAGLPAYLAEGFRTQVSSDAGGSTTAVGGLDALQNEAGRLQAQQLEAGSRWPCRLSER